MPILDEGGQINGVEKWNELNMMYLLIEPMWNRAKRSGKQWAIVELWRLWGKLLPNGVAHHSLNRSSNFPSSLYSLLGLPTLVFTHIFIYLFCILRHFTFSHWTIQSQRIPQVHMSHDMTHEYDVCVVRKINRASFISAIPTISAISTEAFGYLYNSGVDCTVNMCQTMFGF